MEWRTLQTIVTFPKIIGFFPASLACGREGVLTLINPFVLTEGMEGMGMGGEVPSLSKHGATEFTSLMHRSRALLRLSHGLLQ